MPFGGGAGDVVRAIELCKWIWDHCFDKKKTADKTYIDFFNDVKSLQSVLERLQQVVPLVRRELDPLGFDQECKDIAGDFGETLEACKRFLEHHNKLKKKPAGFLTNIKWGVSTHEEVESLRDQLQFHVRVLSLLVGLENTQLWTQIQQDLSELVEVSRSPDLGRPASVPDPVPAWLSSVFQQNIVIAAPFKFTTLEDMPFRNGCAALYRHFDGLSDETRKDVTKSQLNLEYLGLLKCSWLINVLRNGREFNSRRPGFPLRRFISNVGVAVYQRLENRKLYALLPATDDELRVLGADNRAFQIWEIPEKKLKRLPWEEGEGEEKILTVSLTNGEKLVFLRNSQDPTVMRIVPIMETASGISLSHNYSEMRLNTKSDKFIPHYTVNKELVADIHQSGFTVSYQLLDMKAAWQIQRAITGYQVRGDENNVTWSIQRPAFSFSSGPRRRKLAGRAHLWQWNPFSKDSTIGSPAPSTSTASTPRPSTSSPPRPSTASPPRASVESVLSETRSMYSIAESQASTLIREAELPQGRGKHREILQPIPPAIVLFGRSESTHSYVHLDMSGDLEINPKSCDCFKTNGQCRIMVIERPERAKFKIRRVSMEEKFLERWDLAVLRGPVHPAGYKSSDEYISCDYLSIKFPTYQERMGFDEILRTYMGLYHGANSEAIQLEIDAKQEANRPKRKNSTTPYSGSRLGNPYLGSGGASGSASLGNTGTGISSQAPRLPSVYRFSSIDLEK